VHLAYDLRAPGAANLAAFRTLVAAAEGIPKIVHASSAVVYDAWPEGPLDETSPIGSAGGGGYRQAKIAMERMLMGRPGAAAVLQPTIVWGPGSQMWTEGPMNALRGGGLVVPEGCGICPALHVDDLVEALRLSVLAGGSGRERFLISGRARFRWEDLYAAYARRLGREAALFRQSAADLAARLGPEPEVSPDREDAMPLAARVSAGLRRVLGRDRFTHLSAAIGRLRPAGRPSYPDRFLLRLMLASPEISTRKAEEQLGFVARRGLDDGMATIKVE
jgi:nucleoside-diphosphate-sugar epimerase